MSTRAEKLTFIIFTVYVAFLLVAIARYGVPNFRMRNLTPVGVRVCITPVNAEGRATGPTECHVAKGGR